MAIKGLEPNPPSTAQSPATAAMCAVVLGAQACLRARVLPGSAPLIPEPPGRADEGPVCRPHSRVGGLEALTLGSGICWKLPRAGN